MAKVKHTDKPGTPAGTSSKTSESSALKRPAAPSQNPQKTAAKNNGAAGTRGAGKAKVVIGRTIKTQDKYLPIAKGEKISPKDKRWIAIIDFNEKGELAIVKLTTQEQPNTTELKNYKKGNRKITYFKHFVEIEDADGNPIKIDGVRFVKNLKKYDLNDRQVAQVRNKVLNHTRQATENKKKIDELKNGDKKKKQD